MLVIGGGAAGCLVAANLLRRARPPFRLTLVERRRVLGHGVAYGTENSAHRLNVPAVRMGAFPDDAGGFLRWLGAKTGRDAIAPAFAPGDFVPRWLFGEYVRDAWTVAKQGLPDGVVVEEITAEVLDLEEIDGKGRATLAEGRVLWGDRVVLAVGHLPGEYPIAKPEFAEFYRGRRYAHLPWVPEALNGIPPESEVLLVGAGLTSADLALELAGRGHRGRIHLLSRRGLRPQRHAKTEPYPRFLETEASPLTIRALTRRVREELKRGLLAGADWRAVIDALRPDTARLWQALPWEERARFLRHVRPFWEVHRHRVAPEVARSLERLESDGQLQYYAGRLQSLREDAEGVEAVFRRRGTATIETLRVAKVINCTGPRTDYSKFQHPLFVNLLSRGLIDHDPLALGINALPSGEVLRYRGGPTGWLFTLGAPLKGVLWECTAIPEIRAQAAALAERLVEEA